MNNTTTINGVKVTAHEKKVYDYVCDNGTVTGQDVAKALNISPKSATSTLARLNKSLGLMGAVIPCNLTQYYVEPAKEEEA